MKLVVDANIIFSALIKDSFTAELLFNKELELCMPEFILKEFAKHENMLMVKTRKNSAEVREAFKELEKVIRLAPDPEYAPLLPPAKVISPDSDDIAYFALALKLGCPIWSNDKLLKRQEAVRVYSTSELKELFGC